MNELQHEQEISFRSMSIVALIEIFLILILGYGMIYGMASFIFGFYFK